MSEDEAQEQLSLKSKYWCLPKKPLGSTNRGEP